MATGVDSLKELRRAALEGQGRRRSVLQDGARELPI